LFVLALFFLKYFQKAKRLQNVEVALVLWLTKLEISPNCLVLPLFEKTLPLVLRFSRFLPKGFLLSLNRSELDCAKTGPSNKKETQKIMSSFFNIKHKDIYFNRFIILSFIINSIKESNITMELIETIDISQYFELKDTYSIVDVRSPVEFMQGHLPKAHNIPLFTNEERATVGTIYKQQGKSLAIEKGFEFVSPKLLKYINLANEIAPNKKIILHCFRGGMRSKNFGWLLNTAGFEVKIFNGGYKQYRQNLLQAFALPINLIVIGGYTGSAKTGIIKTLALQGEQVLDLEGLAHHKGSSFGSINESKQPSQQNFENSLFEKLSALDRTKPIYVEDESYNIGRLAIPYTLWLQMKQAPILIIKIEAKYRIAQLVKDYATTDVKLLQAAMLRIKDQLGGAACHAAINHLNNGELAEAAALALSYYDKSYDYNHNKRVCKNTYAITSESIDVEKNAQLLLDYYYQHHQIIWEATSLWQQKFNSPTTAKDQAVVVK
jgi:tRNA 2-selenouridine synthase